MKLPTRILLSTLAFAGAISLAARADSAAPTPPDEPVQFTPYVVEGVPLDVSVNPLTRQTSSVMGDARGPLDTPRAVSTITSGLFNERQIHGLEEILPYTPGAYVGADYGNTTTPRIRGDVAETYLDGQRLSSNDYGYFPSFNGVEAVDVVRGPGSAVFGAGYYTGGYVNYVSKQPSFAGPATIVTGRFGTWAPGEVSYRNGSLQVDTTAPVSDRFAWRLSVEAKGGETFLRKNDAPDDRADIYLALAWRPSPATSVDFHTQFFWQNTPETLGINRVTQDLIDHDLYFTGASADLYPYPGAIPATSEVKLPWEAALFSKGDFSNANVFRAQLLVSHTFSPAVTLVNRTLFEYVNRRRYQQFEYMEWVTQHTLENRTELHLDLKAPVPQSVVTGVTVRYAHVLAFENYFNEYVYNFDATDPSRVFSEPAQYPNSYYPGLPGPDGYLFFGAADGSPETADSTLWNPAVFWQDEFKLTPQLSLIAGLRADLFDGTARDALPDPSVSPTPWRDSATVTTFSPSVNLLYHAGPYLSFYATYQRIRSVAGNLGGGGLTLHDDGSGQGVLSSDDFRNRSDLAEVGAKQAFLHNKLYAGIALFDQRRTKIGIGGEHDDLRIRGLELETVFQPDANLSVTANATIQDGEYVNSSPFQLGGRSIYDSYLLGRGPGGLGTSTGDVDPYANQVPVGDWPLVGFSKVMLNGSVRYRLPSGFGAGLNARWQSWQRGNLDNQWHIPAQYTLDASLFYEAKRWTVNLDFLNLTDRHNWLHNGDAYTASALIFRELPFRMEGYVKLKF